METAYCPGVSDIVSVRKRFLGGVTGGEGRYPPLGLRARELVNRCLAPGTLFGSRLCSLVSRFLSGVLFRSVSHITGDPCGLETPVLLGTVETFSATDVALKGESEGT